MTMTAEKDRGKVADNNRVVLLGKVIRAPGTTVLPSGDEVVEFRISVPRVRSRRTREASASVDWFDCAAWTTGTRRTVARWQVGDIVEVTGSLRTRHYLVAGSGRVAVSVEVRGARRVERTDTKQSRRAQGS